jgi:hypothetical protein
MRRNHRQLDILGRKSERNAASAAGCKVQVVGYMRVKYCMIH